MYTYKKIIFLMCWLVTANLFSGIIKEHSCLFFTSLASWRSKKKKSFKVLEAYVAISKKDILC